MSVDVDRKLIFLPTGTPQVDAVLGKGDWDYYGSSVVALNTDTGKPVWHYQFVHKDIWDYDTPAQPMLFDYKAPDGTVPALAQATKMGYIFVLNRADRRADLPGEGNPGFHRRPAKGPVAHPADPRTARTRSPDHQDAGQRHVRLCAGRQVGLPAAVSAS